MENKSIQIRYFKVLFRGMVESHYSKDTKDFCDWINIFRSIDQDTKVIYIEFDNGTHIKFDNGIHLDP